MQRITIANLVLEPETRTLSNLKGDVITLRPLPYNVFTLLLEQKGNCLERGVLFDTCWEGAVVTDQALTNVISALRRYLVKLQAEGIEIKTVSKVGYLLLVDESIIISEKDIDGAFQGIQPSISSNVELENQTLLSKEEVALHHKASPLASEQKTVNVTKSSIIRRKLFTKPSIVSVLVCLFLLMSLFGGYWLKQKTSVPYFLEKDGYQSFSFKNSDVYILNKTKQNINLEQIQSDLKLLNTPLCNAEVYVRIYYSAYGDEIYSVKGYMLAKNSNRNGNFTVNEFMPEQLPILIAEALTRAKLICE